MSNAALVIALARSIGRAPSDEERYRYLSALADLAGGEYVYIAKGGNAREDANKACQLRAAGLSVRKIARVMGCSKSRVHAMVSEVPPTMRTACDM